MVFLCLNVNGMILAALADESLKQEFLLKGIPEGVNILWADTMKVLCSLSDVDAYFDLQFRMDRERTDQLKKLLPKPVFINSVPWTLKKISQPFFRINGWPTLLKKEITEIAINQQSEGQVVKTIFGQLNREVEIVPDIPGMITPRIIAMIINEAYYTFGDGVSSKSDIDLAMRLGTNYPYGPFEWSEKIGLERIYQLLLELNESDKSYSIAPALKIELTSS